MVHRQAQEEHLCADECHNRRRDIPEVLPYAQVSRLAEVVDHFSENKKENRNGLDNRSKHLRDGSGGVNEENCRRRKDNKSGVTGVCYDNASKAWRVQIKLKSRRDFKAQGSTIPSRAFLWP